MLNIVKNIIVQQNVQLCANRCYIYIINILFIYKVPFIPFVPYSRYLISFFFLLKFKLKEYYSTPLDPHVIHVHVSFLQYIGPVALIDVPFNKILEFFVGDLFSQSRDSLVYFGTLIQSLH